MPKYLQLHYFLQFFSLQCFMFGLHLSLHLSNIFLIFFLHFLHFSHYVFFSRKLSMVFISFQFLFGRLSQHFFVFFLPRFIIFLLLYKFISFFMCVHYSSPIFYVLNDIKCKLGYFRFENGKNKILHTHKHKHIHFSYTKHTHSHI